MLISKREDVRGSVETAGNRAGDLEAASHEDNLSAYDGSFWLRKKSSVRKCVSSVGLKAAGRTPDERVVTITGGFRSPEVLPGPPGSQHRLWLEKRWSFDVNLVFRASPFLQQVVQLVCVAA
ncbi:hypothetical protein [Hyphomicrobium sp. 2TAF46]|uniref:hypothetical protein n=1 Tax=Hyphomicrobium sp. 2TAF46 TaxID=3233019 RepID=UPI003F918731